MVSVSQDCKFLLFMSSSIPWYNQPRSHLYTWGLSSIPCLLYICCRHPHPLLNASSRDSKNTTKGSLKEAWTGHTRTRGYAKAASDIHLWCAIIQ